MSVSCHRLFRRMLQLPALFTLNFSVCQVRSHGRLHFSKMAECADQGFQLKEVYGDLFGCAETDSLAHCVSKDMRMGKGIAVLFKKKFGGVDELKKQAEHEGVGGVAVLQRKKRFIYYLITKERYSHKPTYDTLRSSLKAMKAHCQEHQVTSLSMPKIGCGLDKLEWPEVVKMTKEIFKDSAMMITVYTI